MIRGEGAGLIPLTVNPRRDSSVGTALVLDALTQTDLKISELHGRLPEYSMFCQKLFGGDRDVAPSGPGRRSALNRNRPPLRNSALVRRRHIN